MKIFKKICVGLLSMVFVVTVIPNKQNVQAATTWREAYKEVLATYSDDSHVYLVDIDDDGTPEMSVGEPMQAIYTYRDGNLINLMDSLVKCVWSWNGGEMPEGEYLKFAGEKVVEHPNMVLVIGNQWEAYMGVGITDGKFVERDLDRWDVSFEYYDGFKISKASEAINNYGITNEIFIEINGNMTRIHPMPEIVNGRTFVPLRSIGDSLSCEVIWDEATKTVTLKPDNNGRIIIHKIGESTTTVNGVVHTFDAASYIKNDRTMVPIRMIAEAFGAKVDWNADTRTVIIEKN